jgi:hypothetical protein
MGGGGGGGGGEVNKRGLHKFLYLDMEFSSMRSHGAG